MANYSSSIITDMDTKPVTPVSTRKNRGRLYGFIGTVTKLAQADVGGVARLFRLRSDDVLTAFALTNEAIAGLTEVDMGLYKPTNTGGQVVDIDLLLDGISMAAINPAATIATTMSSNANRAFWGMPMWQRLGLAADPGVFYDVCLTFVVDGVAGGAIYFSATVLSGS